MCGITGFISSRLPEDAARPAITRMARSLAHRGPNAEGVWVSQGIALGHRRLSIVDLTDTGAQPLFSPDRQRVIVFNGEIYNFREVARELRRLGHSFRSSGDTEVVLKAIEQWGFEEGISRLAGMFALAYYDLSTKVLRLARDRLGEKPLYYGWSGGSFLFGSELKALTAFPGFENPVDNATLGDFLQFGCVPAPASIYQGVHKLPPGCTLAVSVGSPEGGEKVVPYWSLGESAVSSLKLSLEARHDELVLTEFDKLLSEIVTEQCSADVEVGAFLSGGIDSSLIAALGAEWARKQGRRLHTFTIGFDAQGFDEAPYAREAAKALGTNHFELYVSPGDALRVAERLPEIYDEPFGDSSQIPTFLVSELARGHTGVCLSGDGGDEVFAGYNRHFIGSTIWSRLNKFPLPIRRRLAGVWKRAPALVKRTLSRTLGMIARSGNPGLFAEKMEKLVVCLLARNFEEMYLGLVSLESDATRFLAKGSSVTRFLSAPAGLGGDPLFTMQYLDSVFYLPEDILTKVDRASMAVGLEVRAPFLDHRILERAWALPAHQRIRDGKGKWVLRTLAARHLPASLLNRPKSGFAIPINSWLKGTLRPWAEDLLDARTLRDQGHFNVGAVRAAWQDYIAGKTRNQYLLWNILMFQAWQKRELTRVRQPSRLAEEGNHRLLEPFGFGGGVKSAEG